MSIGTYNAALHQQFSTIRDQTLLVLVNSAKNIALYMQVGLYVLLPLAFVQLYAYMLKQRSKRLAGKGKRR